MDRTFGFINLDYLIKKNKAVIELDKDNSFKMKIVKLNGKKYFIKDIHFNKYNELVIEELLKDYGISSAHYDLAIFNDKECLITEDFRKSSSNYYHVSKLLSDYIVYLKNEFDDDFKYVSNSLEDIWNSLDYRYRNNPKREKIVYNLMNEITNLFIFDLITLQGDRHSQNIQIEENGNEIKLTPIYDSEKLCFNNYKNRKYLQLTVDNNINNDLDFCLKKFIDTSSYEYYQKLIDNLWIISLDNLQNVFKRIEVRTKNKMSFEDKNYYLDNYFKHQKELERILKRR